VAATSPIFAVSSMRFGPCVLARRGKPQSRLPLLLLFLPLRLLDHHFRRPKRTISAAARKRMAAAQRRRWREYRKKSAGTWNQSSLGHAAMGIALGYLAPQRSSIVRSLCPVQRLWMVALCIARPIGVSSCREISPARHWGNFSRAPSKRSPFPSVIPSIISFMGQYSSLALGSFKESEHASRSSRAMTMHSSHSGAIHAPL
jgi:hypothetical protein